MKKSICCNSKTLKHQHIGNYCTWCLQKCETQKTSNKWFIFIVVALALFSYSIDAKAPINKNIIKYHWYEIIHINKDIIPSDSSILVELVQNECVLPNIAIAQSRIETANYTSNICIGNKNLFGIKHNRHGFSKGERNGHAYYDSYKDCIKDYCRIQQMYLKKIDGKYAEDKTYITVIKNLK